MTDAPANLRYERKFVPRGRTLAEILAVVRRHPAAFRTAFPPRAINNIYFDSPTRRDYFDHVNGTAQRVKTRIRWYGPLNGHVPRPTLERKFKRGLVGGKHSYPLPPLEFSGTATHLTLTALLEQAALPEVLLAAVRPLEPALVNRYLRHYFVSADGRFRLTVDSQLEFFHAHREAWSLPDAPRAEVDLVLELKYPQSEALHASAITNVLPFRLVRCSKYVLGLEHLHAI